MYLLINIENKKKNLVSFIWIFMDINWVGINYYLEEFIFIVFTFINLDFLVIFIKWNILKIYLQWVTCCLNNDIIHWYFGSRIWNRVKQLMLVKAELLAAHSKQFHLNMQVFSTWKYCRPSIICRLGITKLCKYLQDSWITSSDRYLL